MRIPLIVRCALLLISLGGCALLDPAPYDPYNDSQITISFSTLDSSKTALKGLAKAYGAKRDAVMLGQYAFDVPIFGLAIATAGAAIAHSSTKTVAELGLGALGVTGAKTYVSPATKQSAYDGAALAFQCAASVTDQLLYYSALRDSTGASFIDAMASRLRAFQTATPAPSATDLATLKKAETDLNTARETIIAAPAKLEAFATALIRAATTKAETGVQNIDAVVKAIEATKSPAPSSASGVTSPSPPPNVGATETGVAESERIQQEQDIATVSSDAESVSANVSTAWGNLTSCTAQSTGS